MPVVDGETAARMIKSTNNLSSSCPIIAVCSHTSAVDAEIGTLFSGTLAKPIVRSPVPSSPFFPLCVPERVAELNSSLAPAQTDEKPALGRLQEAQLYLSGEGQGGRATRLRRGDERRRRAQRLRLKRATVLSYSPSCYIFLPTVFASALLGSWLVSFCRVVMHEGFGTCR
jgi:hypothetical protein